MKILESAHETNEKFDDMNTKKVENIINQLEKI